MASLYSWTGTLAGSLHNRCRQAQGGGDEGRQQFNHSHRIDISRPPAKGNVMVLNCCAGSLLRWIIDECEIVGIVDPVLLGVVAYDDGSASQMRGDEFERRERA